MPGMEDPIGWIREVVLTTPDPHGLAAFWARLVGGTPVEWYDGWVTLEPPPHGQRLSFQRSDDPGASGGHVDVPGEQLDAAHPAPLPVDVWGEQLDAAHAAVLAAGASYVEERWSPKPGPDGAPVPWRVYADPEG